jgi:TM2 domain-containing membrane protein YozV
MRAMTPNQRAAFQSQLAMVRKDRGTALLLTLLLGGIGAHRFYLGQVGAGLAYLLFCWTFIPLIISFFELFSIMGRVDEYNMQQTCHIASGIVTGIR